MRYKTLFFTIGLCWFLFSCGGLKSVDGNEKIRPSYNASQIDSPDIDFDLTMHLRKVPGVQVVGDGANAIFKIRNASSLNASTSPLFVVGSMQMRDYSAVYNSVNVRDIQSIQVLKDPSETSFYGVNGANGVIIINLID